MNPFYLIDKQFKKKYKMQYQQLNNGTQSPYPNHDVPADKKGEEWCRQYARAAYFDWSFAYPKGIFANNGGDYERNSMYALGKQPVSPYKSLLGIDAQTNNTWLSVDWTVRGIGVGYRNKALSRLMKEDYSVIATPVDILAKTELDEYYADLKAKIAVRQLLMQQGNQGMLNSPQIALQKGEPQDVEELEMRVELGEQFNRAKDAELAINLGFYENDHKAFRRLTFENLFDHGVSGFKHWLGDDNKPKFRVCKNDSVIISYTRDPYFGDIVHAGEVINVPLVELATLTDEKGELLFNEKELQEFAGSIAGKFGNPTILGRGTGWLKPYDKFKCQVFDIEFYTYNEETYTDRVDDMGNAVFRIEKSGRGDRNNPRYKRKKIQYVYKCKWIVGTDKCYDWGKCYDQVRSNDPKKKAQTKLSYHFVAYNFYEMKAQSFMSLLIPYLDDYQLTMLKIQNFKNRAVPSGWWIDLDALENVALNKGGKNMQPNELLQMFYETGVLVGRSVDASGNPQNPNWKPVIPIENTAASELAMFYQDLINTISMIEKLTGFNDVTSGNPNPKTLVPGYEVAQQSTADALYPMAAAEEYLSLKLAEAVLCRMQQGLKKAGTIEGYVPALNTNTINMIQLSSYIAFRDYGIQLEKKMSDDQRMWLLQQMQQDIMNGWLDTSDAVILVNTHNTKQAQMIWAYKVKKAKEAQNQQKLAELEKQNEGAIQSAQIAQQAELQKLQMELASKEKLEYMKIQGELQKELIRQQGESGRASEKHATQIEVADTTAQAKVITQQVSNMAKSTTQP